MHPRPSDLPFRRAAPPVAVYRGKHRRPRRRQIEVRAPSGPSPGSRALRAGVGGEERAIAQQVDQPRDAGRAAVHAMQRLRREASPPPPPPAIVSRCAT